MPAATEEHPTEEGARDPAAQVVLRRTTLHARQLRAGGRMVPFGGWELPVQYAGIIAEHEAVREHVGVFDVSHMGRVWLSGPAAAERLRAVTTYDVTAMAPGEAHYSLYCNAAGGIDDDVFIYRVEAERWLVVHNAANAAAGFERLRAVVDGADAQAAEVTAETVMLAVQGPQAVDVVASILHAPLADMEARSCRELRWRGAAVLVGRTGYTGEDGVECVLDGEAGVALWDALLERGVPPVGLGARDTLRLEAALPLHGHEIDATTTPYEARLGWTVSLDDGAPFTGREALLVLSERAPERRLAHLRLEGRGVPREGYAVLDPQAAADVQVGTLTSGAFSPRLRVGIAMAYLPPALTKPGTPLAVEIRRRAVPTRVVRRPFYRRGE